MMTKSGGALLLFGGIGLLSLNKPPNVGPILNGIGWAMVVIGIIWFFLAAFWRPSTKPQPPSQKVTYHLPNQQSSTRGRVSRTEPRRTTDDESSAGRDSMTHMVILSSVRGNTSAPETDHSTYVSPSYDSPDISSDGGFGGDGGSVD